MTPNCFMDLPESGWVIPHHSPLDYCHVRVLGWGKSGRLRVTGIRTLGWIADGARVTCSIPPDKLTQINSLHTEFLNLYEDPCHPIVQDY